MIHRNTWSLPLAAAALLACGCSATASFPLDRRLQVAGEAERLLGVQAVDLSASGDAWVNRGGLKGVTIRSARATITSVDGGTSPAYGSGTLALRPDGAPADGSEDVVFGRFDDLPIQPGLELPVAPTPEASAVLREALEGSGRLALVVRGETGPRPVGFAVNVQLEVGVRYDPLKRL